MAIVAGCASPGPHGPAAPTQADRMLQTYRDIQRGRLLILADFEDPRQLSMFSLAAASDDARITLDPKKGKPETGTGCLFATLGSAGDAIVFASSAESQWYLKRDWRPYDLLMISVYAPKGDVSLEVGIGSGMSEARLYARSSTPLSKGWNLVRLDLAEAAEQIPIDDVREIRLSLTGIDKPVQVRFDDLLLAGNRVDIFGNSADKEGRLYVQQAGRRWNVGAGGRFELAFANGQITALYNTAADPYRLRNFVRGTTLGPSPVVLDESATSLGDFSAFGRSVVARQRILEMNPVRVVVECEWRFVDKPDDPTDKRPFQRWVYSIYPTGQIFVGVESTTRADSWSPPNVGLAVTFASGAPDVAVTSFRPEPSGASEHTDAPMYALARFPAGESALLFLPYLAGRPARFIELTDSLRRRTSLILVDQEPDSPTRKWACQVVFSDLRTLDEDSAMRRATNYSKDGLLQVEIGRLAAGENPLFRSRGFDPASGMVFVETEKNRVRMTLDARTRPAFAPAFHVSGGRGVQSWVYVGHLIHSPVASAADGGLIFQLPDFAEKQLIVEVLYQHSNP